MGIPQEKISEKLTLLNVILWGAIPSHFRDKHLGKGKIDLIEIGGKTLRVITAKNSIHAHYDYILLEESASIVDLKELTKQLQKVAIIYFINYKNEKFYKELISCFNKVETKNHPFIIFSRDDGKFKNTDYYKKYIIDSNLKIDPLNIYSVDTYSGDSLIFQTLEKIENYYNEEENKIKINIDIGINLCILGKPGKGKSSFINCIAGEKIALEGPGQNITTKFNRYKILKEIRPFVYGLLNIYDCPGFTIDGKEIKNIYSIIDEKFTLFKRNHDYIHGFLYFAYEEHNRTLEETEIELIDHIYKKLIEYNQNSIILFIINHKEDQNSINSYKNTLLSSLKNNFGNNIANENNIIYVNVKDKIFGIDKVFKKLYDFFIPNKIKILNNNNDNEQKKLINKSIFFKYITKEETMIKRYRKSCEAVIQKYSFEVKDAAKKLNKEEIIVLRKRMLMEIEEILNSSLYKQKLELQDQEKYEIQHWYGWLVKIIPFLGKWLEGEFMSEQSQRITNEIGNNFINVHIENMRHNSNNAFCLDASNRFNNSIDLLKNISESFEDKDSIKYDWKKTKGEFIIKFKTDFEEPKIKSTVEEIGEFYIFIIKISNAANNIEKKIVHKEKIIDDFILEKLSRDRTDKNNIDGKCEVSIYFKLKKINYDED